MKKVQLKIVAVLLAVSVAGVASAESAAPQYDYNWQGYYFAGDLGGVWGSNDFDLTNPGHHIFHGFSPLVNYPGASFSQNTDGVIGGGAFGINWQWGHVVAGVETEMDGSDISATTTTAFSQQSGDHYTTTNTYEADINWLYTLTPRLGYSWQNFLFYSKLGFALANVTSQLTSGYDSAEGYIPNPISPVAFNGSTYQTGLDVGAGIDYAVNTNWIVGAEYDYYYLGTTHFGGASSPADQWPVDYTVQSSFSTIRASIAYKFGM